MKICISAGGKREPNKMCLMCLLEVQDKDCSEEDSIRDHPVQATDLPIAVVEGLRLCQHLVPQADQSLILDPLQPQAAELGGWEGISTIPIMLVEEFLSVIFMENSILEGIDLRDKDVFIMDS